MDSEDIVKPLMLRAKLMGRFNNSCRCPNPEKNSSQMISNFQNEQPCASRTLTMSHTGLNLANGRWNYGVQRSLSRRKLEAVFLATS
jgi:hypothetical protein